MARIRTIKPEFFMNEELGRHCSHAARLLAIGLLQLADCQGRMRWIPSVVVAHVFPWETIDLSPLLHELCTVDYLRIYRVRGREYAWIPGFNKHQRLTGKEAAAKSQFPSWDEREEEEKQPHAKVQQEGSAGSFPGKHPDAQEQGTGNREQGKINSIVETSSLGRAKPDDSDARSVIEYLNEKAGRRYEPVEANLKLIRARLKEKGRTIDQLKAVVDRKVEEWRGTKFEKYLRPATLFNTEKFGQYVGELGTAIHKPDEKKALPEWARLPFDDDKLWGHAKTHGFSNPGTMNYTQYRQRLRSEIEARLSKDDGQ